MNILLTTIVDNINFGTYLQAYATVRKMEERGHSVDVLNYIRPYLTGKYYALMYLRNKKRPLIIRYIYCLGYISLNRFMIWQVKRFLSTRAKLTDAYQSLDEIKKNISSYDMYLTGSDQVWNSVHNLGIDKIFFWDFVDGRKVSYAASIGMGSFPESQRNEVKKMLSKYECISVRESFGVSALNQIGISNVRHVLDPTLLLNKDEWSEIASKSGFKKSEPFLLVYSVELERNSFVISIAHRIAKKRNLKVYLVCPTLKFKKKIGVDRVFNFTSVETFLSLFMHADYIVVSSFHGTAFAINFNKQFITVSPGRFNTRVNSLLSLLNLNDRYINSENVDLNMGAIDYCEINKKLNNERGESEAFIDHMLI